jgi:hypothetical protein
MQNQEFDLHEIDPRTAQEIDMELVARDNAGDRVWRRMQH